MDSCRALDNATNSSFVNSTYLWAANIVAVVSGIFFINCCKSVSSGSLIICPFLFSDLYTQKTNSPRSKFISNVPVTASGSTSKNSPCSAMKFSYINSNRACRPILITRILSSSNLLFFLIFFTLPFMFNISIPHHEQKRQRRNGLCSNLSGLLQHPVHIQPIPLRGVTDKHMRHRSHNPPVLDDRAAGHPLHNPPGGG